MKTFNVWLEDYRDIHGFEELQAKQQPPPPKPEDELPIQSFSLNRLIDTLSREQFGNLPMRRPFEDQVQWGDNDGAIRARLTPNQGVSIERMTTDLRGKPFWVVKRLVKMKTNDYVGHEDSVASDISDFIKEIAMEQVDAATANYQGLAVLTHQLANRIKGISKNFAYEEIKKISENNYNILMSMNGGVGKVAHSGRRPNFTAAGIIDMSYDPERGSIKSILTTIDIENEGGSWVIDVPYFMGEFSPSQPMEEIIQSISAGLRFI